LFLVLVSGAISIPDNGPKIAGAEEGAHAQWKQGIDEADQKIFCSGRMLYLLRHCYCVFN